MTAIHDTEHDKLAGSYARAARHRLNPPRTHLDTLEDNTPKARRRIRRLAGLRRGAPIGLRHLRLAIETAAKRERAEAERVRINRVTEGDA